MQLTHMCTSTFYAVLDGDFLDGLFRSFADLSYLNTRSSLIREFESELLEHITIDRDRDMREGREFSVRELLERLVERVKEEAADEYGTVFEQVKICIRDLIQVLEHIYCFNIPRVYQYSLDHNKYIVAIINMRQCKIPVHASSLERTSNLN